MRNRFSVTPPQVHLAFGMLSFLLGFAFVMGGTSRTAAAAYSVIAAEGGPYVWGTVFITLGVALIMSVDRIPLMRALLLVGAGAYAVLAAAFAISALQFPEANFTAVVAYGGYSAFHLCAFFRSRERIDEEDDS